MKTFLGFLFSIVILFTSGSALAITWPDNIGWRIATMGGAALAFEDETTALTLFNHENPAGIVFEKNLNRTDGGLSYISKSVSGELWPGMTQKTVTTEMGLIPSGAEYGSSICRLTDNMFLSYGVGGGLSNINTTLTSPVATIEDTFSTLAYSGLAYLAYKFDFGLALGGGLAYSRMTGGPQSLDGIYNLYAPYGGSTSKFDLSAGNLNWDLGAAYVKELANGNSLTLGIQCGADDELPNLDNVDPTDPTSLVGAQGDFDMILDLEGTIPLFGDSSGKTRLTPSPLKVGGEAIFNLGTMLEAGLLFDYKMRELNYKEEANGSVTADFKIFSESGLGLTPVVRAKLQLGEDLHLLPGAMFTTWGSGIQDSYTIYLATNETFKDASTTINHSTFALGLGVQALGKKLQAGLQYAFAANTATTSSFNPDGSSAGPDTDVDSGLSKLQGGAEYWLLPIFALRAGYAILTDTLKEGALNPSGDPVDLRSLDNRITFGLGLAIPDGLAADLLVKLDTITQEPKPDPVATHNVTDISLGLHLPF